MLAMVTPPNPEYLKFLSPYDPRIQQLALATRAMVLAEAPDSIELIYDAYNAVASGYSFTGRTSECFIHIAVYAKWVNLGFNHGSQLADPNGHLKGVGKWVRHIRIAELADLERAFIPVFVKEAIAKADRPSPGATVQKGASEVRAIYPKRRRPSP